MKQNENFNISSTRASKLSPSHSSSGFYRLLDNKEITLWGSRIDELPYFGVDGIGLYDFKPWSPIFWSSEDNELDGRHLVGSGKE
jgi:hypothetical protein